MYSDNIFAENDQVQKNVLKQSYSNNHLSDHQTFSVLSKNHHSTHSLPVVPEEKSSFTQFLADEKCNLQFFHSFKATRQIINRQKNEKKLIRNFDFLSVNMPNNSTIDDGGDEKSPTTCVIHSSNVASSTSSNIISAKNTKLMTSNIAHKTLCVMDINKKRRVHCVERPISYIPNEQTKATLCFILQLNTYINSEKDFNKMNEFYIQSTKLDVSPEKIIGLDTNTTSTLDFISKPNLNETHGTETNDSIDISMQLSDHPEYSSKIVWNENDDNRLLMDHSLFNKTTNSLGSMVHSSLKKEGKVENQQTSVSTISDRQKIITKNDDKIIDCCYNQTEINRKTDYDALNLIKMPNEIPTKSEKVIIGSSSNFTNRMTTSRSMRNIAHVANRSTKPLQRVQTPIKSTNKTEENRQQQSSTMLNSSLTNSNYHLSESSIDLRNLLNESIEQNSSLPIHSRCLASFEFANREEHLVEVVELPRSFHRVSRMDMYKKIHQRLAVMSLIDIDLTALLRNILQSFS